MSKTFPQESSEAFLNLKSLHYAEQKKLHQRVLQSALKSTLKSTNKSFVSSQRVTYGVNALFFNGYYRCVTSHMKLFKPCTTHVIAWSITKGFNQSIRRTKEQQTRLQCLAWAMPKSVMPSGAMKSAKLQRKSARIWVLAKTPQLNRFFQ